jgi:hypothetical protein
MSRFSTGYDDGDGFREGGGAVKDGNLAISQEKMGLLNYQQKLDALAASIGVDKYTLLLAERLAKGDKVIYPYGDKRIVVKGEYSEQETRQASIDQATAILPLLANLIWPKA